LKTVLELPLPASQAQQQWIAFSATEPGIASRVVGTVQPMGERFSSLTLAGTYGAIEIAVDAFMDFLAQSWLCRPPGRASSPLAGQPVRAA